MSNTASGPAHWAVFENLSLNELSRILAEIARRHPEYEPHLDTALESALRYPPTQRQTLTGYLTLLAKHAFLNANRKRPVVSIESILESRSENVSPFFEDSLPGMADPVAEQEFERAEKEFTPLSELAWYQQARTHLIAKQFLDSKNKYGKSERPAWERRRRVLELLAQLAEADEYDHRPIDVLAWMRARFASEGHVVEQQTLHNDLSAVRAIVAEFCRSKV